jgi:hypothetical protein
MPLPSHNPGQLVPREPSVWVSWSVFIYADMPYTMFPQFKALDYLVTKMEYTGEIYGLPEMPEGFGDIMKSTMAGKVIGECLERAKAEAWDYLKERIEREGVQVLQQILDGGPVFKD